MRRHPGVAVGALLASVLLAGAVTGDALAPPDPITTIDASADAPTPAAAIFDAPEVISVSERRGLTLATINSVNAAANYLGVTPMYGRGFTLGMRQIVRGVTPIKQSTAPGWAFPIAVTALPLQAIGTVMGRDVSGPIAAGKIVISQSAATFHQAAIGDRFVLYNSGLGEVSFTVGLIAPDSQVGGAEVVMSVDQAGAMGATTDTRILLYGQLDHTFVNNVLGGHGLVSGKWLRVSRSWDAAGPDDTISLIRTKQLLGEFDLYYAGLANSDWVTRSGDGSWNAANLPPAKVVYPGGVSALCHNAISSDLWAALAEVQSTLPSLVQYDPSNPNYFTGINVRNSNLYGGCATANSARLSRISNGTGTVSRHSWGQAIDVSTIPNCQGCEPKLDCRIVRIFRKHNFAWGGNFLEPDGMHFEWVGEQRHLIQTHVNYCDNPPLPLESENQPPPRARDSLFADDGWSEEHE